MTMVLTQDRTPTHAINMQFHDIPPSEAHGHWAIVNNSIKQREQRDDVINDKQH
jgi:hypothetical protein